MKKHFLLCINDGGAPEALERRKFYEVIDDPSATAEGLVRVVDESGEDYLYPKEYFADVALPSQVQEALSAA